MIPEDSPRYYNMDNMDIKIIQSSGVSDVKVKISIIITVLACVFNVNLL